MLMPEDGNVIAAMLFEYQQQLQVGIQQMPEGSPERAAAQIRVQQLGQMVGRVQSITMPAEGPPAGASEPQPPAEAPAPEPAQPQPQT
jgi:hypothetical protein